MPVPLGQEEEKKTNKYKNLHQWNKGNLDKVCISKVRCTIGTAIPPMRNTLGFSHNS